MKHFYFYMDDQSNSWFVMREHDAPEPESDTIGPTGLPAVTMREEMPVDECMISFRPAHMGSKRDIESQRTRGKGFYFIQLSFVIDESQFVLSKQTYKWPEAIKVAEIFQGLSYEKAKKLFISREY